MTDAVHFFLTGEGNTAYHVTAISQSSFCQPCCVCLAQIHVLSSSEGMINHLFGAQSLLATIDLVAAAAALRNRRRLSNWCLD